MMTIVRQLNRTVHKIQSKPRSKYNFLQFRRFSLTVYSVGLSRSSHRRISLFHSRSTHLLHIVRFYSASQPSAFSSAALIISIYLLFFTLPASFNGLNNYSNQTTTKTRKLCNVIKKLNAPSKIAYECKCKSARHWSVHALAAILQKWTNKHTDNDAHTEPGDTM